MSGVSGVHEAILARFREELRATPYAAQALSWIRGPKCVASSSSLEVFGRRWRRPISYSLLAYLLASGARFFEPYLFSASQVKLGSPRQTSSCTRRRAWASIRRRASWSRIQPRTSVRRCPPAGGRPSSAAVTRRASWPDHLHSLGASAVISDVRALKTAIVELRGW
jgi:hypothetical protein